MVLHLLKQEKGKVQHFSNAITKMRDEIHYCSQCNNISDHPQCSICSDRSRNPEMICVVENIRDIISIENTHQYHGLYHVLGGLLSPLDGIGPEQLFIGQLKQRAAAGQVQEIIMALSPTIEGDTTVYYLSRQLQDCKVRITGIARGVSFGGELEYTDEITLGRAIAKRLPVDNYVKVSMEASPEKI